MNCPIGNGLPCPGYTVFISRLFSFSTLAFAAVKSSIIELRPGFLVFSSRSPQNISPSVVRIPIEPLECPGIYRTLASNPYSEKSYPSSIYKSGLNLADLPNLKRIGAIFLIRKLPLFLFQNMFPCSTIPESSLCIAIFVSNLLRR